MNYVKTIFYIFIYICSHLELYLQENLQPLRKKIFPLLEEMKICLKICLIIEKN